MKNINDMIKEIGKPLTKEQKQIQAEKEEELKRDKKREYLESISGKVANIKKQCNIPKRYIDAKYEAITPEQEKLQEKFKEAFKGKQMKDMNDILIYGNVGTGKTYLSIGLLNEYIKNGIYCKYGTENQILDAYFQKDYDKFESFKKVDILVIDEIGKRQLQDWQMIQLEELISHRYNEMLTTIYITNMNMEQFKGFVGDRVVDRLKDNKVVRATMIGDSLRGK